MLFFVLAFRLVANTPFTGIYIVEAVFSAMLGAYFFIYGLSAVLSHAISHRALWWLCILTSSMMLWSGWAALLTFGQPLVFGVLAQRDLLLCFAGIYLYLSLRTNRVNLDEIERVFVFLAWGSALTYLVLINVLDPNQYRDVRGFIAYSELRGGYLFHFNVLLIVFGAIYYLVRSLFLVRLSSITAALFFLSYLVLVHKGRAVLIALVLSLALMIIFYVSSRQRLRFLLWLVPLGALIVVALVFSGDGATGDYSRLFGSAFSVLQGTSSVDTSANARLWEIAAAVKYIAANPLVGSGELSHQWNGGFQSAMGYFYPSDIGLVGVVFVYGVLGLVLLHLHYFWIARYARTIQCEPNQGFLFAAKIFCLYFLINSIVTGDTVFSPAISFVLLALFAFHYENQRALVTVAVPGSTLSDQKYSLGTALNKKRGGAERQPMLPE
jgi:hypothetical protein